MTLLFTSGAAKRFWSCTWREPRKQSRCPGLQNGDWWVLIVLRITCLKRTVPSKLSLWIKRFYYNTQILNVNLFIWHGPGFRKWVVKHILKTYNFSVTWNTRFLFHWWISREHPLPWWFPNLHIFHNSFPDKKRESFSSADSNLSFSMTEILSCSKYVILYFFPLRFLKCLLK